MRFTVNIFFTRSCIPPVWEIAVHLAVACDVYDGVFLCCPFSPRDVLDEILNLNESESVSEVFSTYSHYEEHSNGQCLIMLLKDRCNCRSWK